jgi:hypothetical protein
MKLKTSDNTVNFNSTLGGHVSVRFTRQFQLKSQLIFIYIYLGFFQFAMVVIKIGNTFFDIDKNVFNNILEMKQIVLPFEWHSYCISVDLVKKRMKLYHNDHIQAVQNFTIKHGDKDGLSKLMTKGHLGGPKFVGFLTDFQIFGTALPDEEIFKWTSCQIEVNDTFKSDTCMLYYF